MGTCMVRTGITTDLRHDLVHSGRRIITRRRFTAALGIGLIAPGCALAQQKRIWRIGFLSLDTPDSTAGQQALEQFPAALRKFGYVEGSNAAIEWRWGDGKSAQLGELAAGLVRDRVDIIAEQGGLLHYAPDIGEYYERTADYVDRILRGAKPADLPVHQPTRYELVINVKTAKAIGIVIPPGVLARANRLISE